MSEEAKTTGPAPCRRQASNTFQAPATFTSSVSRGDSRATPTIVCAARWKTASQPATAALDFLGVAQVGLDQLHLSGDPQQLQPRAARPADVGLPRRRPVEHPHPLAALEQRPRQVRGDEAVPAADQRGLQGEPASAGAQGAHGASPAAQRSLSSTASL